MQKTINKIHQTHIDSEKVECNCYFCFHQHSVQSVRDGATSVKNLVKRHLDLGMKYFLITDHGNISATYDVFTECEKVGIIPIIGCEFYMPYLDPEKKNKSHHITAVVLNETGWKNMLKLQYLSQSKEEIKLDDFEGSFFFRAKVTLEMLEYYCGDGIAITSGCRASMINWLFLEGRIEESIDLIIRMKNNIKHFFIEIHVANNEVEERMYYFLKEQAIQHNIPMLIANDTHYEKKGDLITWNLLNSSRSNSSILDTEYSITNDDFFIKSFNEIKNDVIRIEYKKDGICSKETLLNMFSGFHILTSLIDFKWSNRKLPMLHFEHAESNLREYLWLALINKFNGKENIPDNYIARLKEEFEIAKQTHNISYFYLIQMFLTKCKERGIMLSNGRGSASSLLICHLIGASRVDPIPYGLIIERAMNIDRPKLMDVDLDFSKSEGVIAFEILQEMFGVENVCHIVNFGYSGIKQSVQTVCRFLKVAPNIADAITKELDKFESEDEHGNKVTSKADQEQQLILLENHDFITNYAQYLPDGRIIKGTDFIDLVKRNWNTINNLSIHASGILIMNQPIYNQIPIIRINDTICSAYDMEVLEKLNGLKLDVLRITTNDLIKDGLNEMVKQGLL